MSAKRRVLICGSSLLISGVQANLGTLPELDLEVVDAQPEHIREKISIWKPEVVILETGLLQCAFPLQDFPELKIIGLDIEDNRLLVLTGSASYEPTPEDLLRVIKERKIPCKRGMEVEKPSEGEPREGSGKHIQPEKKHKTHEKKQSHTSKMEGTK